MIKNRLLKRYRISWFCIDENARIGSFPCLEICFDGLSDDLRRAALIRGFSPPIHLPILDSGMIYSPDSGSAVWVLSYPIDEEFFSTSMFN